MALLPLHGGAVARRATEGVGAALLSGVSQAFMFALSPNKGRPRGAYSQPASRRGFR
jgi:hypothetical protein